MITKFRKTAAEVSIVLTLAAASSCTRPPPMGDSEKQVVICGRLLARGAMVPLILHPHRIPSGKPAPPPPDTSIIPPINSGPPELIVRAASGCTHGAIIRVVPTKSVQTQKIIHAPDGGIIAITLSFPKNKLITVYVYQNGKIIGEITTSNGPVSIPGTGK